MNSEEKKPKVKASGKNVSGVKETQVKKSKKVKEELKDNKTVPKKVVVKKKVVAKRDSFEENKSSANKKESSVPLKSKESIQKKVVVKKKIVKTKDNLEKKKLSNKKEEQGITEINVIRNEEPIKNNKVIKKKVVVKKAVPVKSKSSSELSSKNNTLEKQEEAKKPLSKKTTKQKMVRNKSLNKVGKILLSVVIVILVYLFILPFSVTLKTKGDTKTINGTLNLEVDLSSMKPMSEVYYAINPKDKDDIKHYEKLKTSGNIFGKKIKLNQIDIPVGENKLYIYTKSYLFSHTVKEIPITFDLGYIGESDTDKIVKTDGGLKIFSDELLFKVKENSTESDLKKLVEEEGGEIVGALYFANQYQVKFSTNSENELKQIKEKLEHHGIVEKINYNYSVPASFDANKNTEVFPKASDLDIKDALEWKKDWYLKHIEADKALKEVKGKTRIKVGVYDSPIDYNHEDLGVDINNANIPSTAEFKSVKEIRNFMDTHKKVLEASSEEEVDRIDSYNTSIDHGTHVTGIISAYHNNKGATGINDCVTIMASGGWYYNKETLGNGKEILTRKQSDFSSMYGLSYLVMSGCRVINISSGIMLNPSDFSSEEFSEEIEMYRNLFENFEAAGKDFLIVKAAGNDNEDTNLEFLSRLFTGSEIGRRHTIVVGAIDPVVIPDTENEDFSEDSEKQYRMADYSNFGELIDVVAPGTDIYSTVSWNKYELWDGTSMAAPVVSGVASLVYRVNPEFSSEEVKKIILSSTEGYSVKNSQVYPIINAYNAVKTANDVTNTKEKIGKLKEKEPAKYGYIQGKIQDAKTAAIIEQDTVIRITKPNDDKFSVLANAQLGNYEIFLEPGTYHMEVYTSNYVTEKIYNIEVTEGIVTYNILLNLVKDSTEGGNASGSIVDAFDASKISNATLKFYRGINLIEGDPVQETVAGSDGQYYISLAPGNYTIQASANGYTTGTANIVVLSGETKKDQDCTLTPVLKEGEIRAILTWGEKPRDLDSHLVGPTAEGGKFHVYFSSKNFNLNGQTYNKLDVDDTTSYGPETTSVYLNVGGTYTYYVHDYSNKYSSNSSALSQSGAMVKLYVAGRDKPYIYYAPTGNGTLWKVFSMTDGKITPINELSYESNPIAVGTR